MIVTGSLTCVVVCALAGSAAAISNLPQTTTTAIVVDGIVNSVAANGSTVLIGGAFRHAGAYTGAFASAPTSGGTLASLPAVNGTVNAIAPDGSGGWYVGGSFTSVGQTSVTNLAHITSSQTVAAGWNPAPDNTVNALALSSDGTTLYVGGSFATIGGTTRNGIAALTASSGATAAWNPNANAAVTDLVLSPDGATLYVAGSFTSVGGSSRSGLAALTTSGGVASTWNPAPDNTVSALAVSSDGVTVYAGGSFANIGGATRSNLAAISASTGSATSWTPQPDGAVSALALSSNSSTVYAGGTFASAGGQARTNVAAISASAGTATSWDPSPDGAVNALAVSTDGNTVYAGGAFANIGGQSRDHVGALSVSNGTATSWQEDANATVSALAVTSSSVGIGGALSGVGLQARNEVAAFSTSSGLLSVNPGASGGAVSAVALSSDGSTAYVGGAFTSLGGQTRNRIGAFSMTTGLVTSWNPNATSGTVLALAVAPNGTVYAGGTFIKFGSVTRNRIAALDTSGVPTAWDPNATSGQVDTIALATSSGTVSTVYVGGTFTTIGGQTRNRIAGLDPSTANATSFDPSATSGQVNALLLSSDQSKVYAGGTFTSIGGQTRNRIAELDATTGTADATWNPNSGTTSVTALALSSDGATVYVGGSFTSIGGQTRNRLAALTSTGSGTATTWNPNASTTVNALAVASSGMIAGGAFATIGSIPTPDLASFSFDVPVETVLPSITGTPTVGSTLTCSNGTWANGPTSYTYVWQRNGTAISGATASTYQLVSGDLGQPIACKVTAKNGEGSASVTSSSTTVVAAPQNTVAPTVLGSAQSGSLLTCSPGTWAYSPAFTYSWLRDGSAISGASNATYTAAAADVGHAVACRVKGTNAAGSAQASSAGVAIAAAAGGTTPVTPVVTTGGEVPGNTAAVDTSSGSLAVPAVAALTWPAGTFPGPGTLSVEQLKLTANIDGFSHTSPLLSVGYLPSGSVIASPAFLQQPLTIVFPAARTNKTAYVAYLNNAGTAWTPLPQLSSPQLAAGQLDGYYLRADSAIVVYTHHTATYGLLQDIQAPTAPMTFVATLSGATLRLRWPPSADNSRRIRSYQVLRGKKVVASFKGSLTAAHLSLAGLAQTSVFSVRAVDPAGNVSKPSPAIRIVVKARPAIVPKRIPTWAPRLRAWSAKPASARGRRPVTPKPVPAWYAAWRTWLATRLSLRP